MSMIWTSLVRISGDRNNLILCGYSGAYVWMVARASDSEEFRRSIERTLVGLQLTLVSMEEVRTADEVDASDTPSKELAELIADTRQDERGISNGRFYRFASHDADYDAKT